MCGANATVLAAVSKAVTFQTCRKVLAPSGAANDKSPHLNALKVPYDVACKARASASAEWKRVHRAPAGHWYPCGCRHPHVRRARSNVKKSSWYLCGSAYTDVSIC